MIYLHAERRLRPRLQMRSRGRLGAASLACWCVCHVLCASMPDPVTLAGAFATLVQLLAIFKQERGDKASANHQQFIDWLADHRHEELKQFIANSAAAKAELDNFLRQDHAIMLQNLNSINQSVVSIAANISELRGLARAIAPGAEFSEQALSILRQMVAAHTEISLCRNGREFQLVHVTTEEPPMEYTDSKFLEDDMRTLEAAGLLTSEWGEFGTVYRVTRQAVRFVEALDGQK
jgi:hypothetical protein